MKILKENLNPHLLTRVESIDNKFIGYTGDKYVYILDIITSQIDGDIILKFWILNEIDETSFIRVPNGNEFIFQTQQRDGHSFKSIDNEDILIYDEAGDIVTEEVIVGQDEEGNDIIEMRPVLRVREFSRNIENFAPVLAPAIFTTVKRFLGETI